MMKFIIYRDSIGEYRWNLKASNGEIVAASEGYTTKKGAKLSVAWLQKYAANALVIDLTE